MTRIPAPVVVRAKAGPAPRPVRFPVGRPRRQGLLAAAVLLAATLSTPSFQCPAAEPPPAASAAGRPLFLAHVMPWYEAPPAASRWGWHWTMNTFSPDTIRAGQREIASRFQPVIGAYDSGDPQVIEHHLLLMRIAGIDGVIIDWYGRDDFRDHALIHRNAARLVAAAAGLGMKVAVCYEDRVLEPLVAAGRIAAADRVAHVAADLRWLARNWFPLECHARIDGRPLFLSFGRQGLDDAEWSRAVAGIAPALAYVSQQQRRTAAVGGFDWPLPREGLAAIDRFERESRDWPHRVPVVFPRFADIYEQAGVHESYGVIPDDDGRTFRATLARALALRPAVVQIATWNDWGEGTQIEPSQEFGTRDLEVVQEAHRRHRDAGFPFRPADFPLATRILAGRRGPEAGDLAALLDEAVRAIAAGDPRRAAAVLDAIDDR